jgi:hypothetical protein
MMGIPLCGRGLEVRGIDAVPSLAEVVDLCAFRDGTDPRLEREPVCIDGLPVAIESRVPPTAGVRAWPDTQCSEPTASLLDDTGEQDLFV